MFLLLVKSSLVLAILLLFYKVVLEKESFFSTNRFYLLFGLLFSFVLPFVALPEIISEQGIVEDLVISIKPLVLENQPDSNNILTLNSEKGEQLNVGQASSSNNGINYLRWISYIYIFGVVVFVLHFLSQLISVFIKIKTIDDKIIDDNYTIINSSEVKEPCSFFNYIFINPEQYTYEEYQQILEHEKIHVSKKHSWDLIISELSIIILWFNPLVWYYRKQIEKVIEFQTDRELLTTNQGSKETYQMNLVKIATYNRPLTLTTNYNQSLIKQRLLKMNAKQSNPHSLWKYLFVLPLVFVTLLTVNKPLNAINDTLKSQLDSGIDSLSLKFLTDKKTAPEKLIIPAADSAHVNEKLELKPKTSSKKNKQKLVKVSNCDQLINAIKEKNLNRVEFLLKVVNPNCLERMNDKNKEQLKLVKELIAYSEKVENKSLKKTEKDAVDEKPKKEDAEFRNSKGEILAPSERDCKLLQLATLDRDYNTIKDLFNNGDLNCLRDYNGGPPQHLVLIREMLNRGAMIDIDNNNMMLISGIGEKIMWDDDEETDPSFTAECLELKKAAKEGKQRKTRVLLFELEPGCLKNEAGEINDLVFIKEMLKNGAKLELDNYGNITIYGIGIQLDMNEAEW